ncbi:MAG: type 2 isopentenyl-diphosphate Delta-isomerase [Nitrososphaerales archaeon]
MKEDEKEVIAKRKLDGLKIPLERNVQARTTSTLLECVHLIHNALPELDFNSIDTSTTFLNHRFGAPILIDAMTGGTPEATKINANLAAAAEKLNLGMVLGSQRAALLGEDLAETYRVARKEGPNIFLAANIGGAQLARGLSVENVKKLIDIVKADALVVHLNPLQELIQPEGEPTYKGVLERIRELTKQLNIPIIVKEVGCGISREVALKLQLAGVAAINVAGAGGTSWAGIESQRAQDANVTQKAELGEVFWDWGVPTAAALIEVVKAVKVPVIASGGIRTGLEAAKCIALGAALSGMAYPLLKAAVVSKEEVEATLNKIILHFKATMFLVGAQKVSELRNARKVITQPLKDWLG